MGRGGWIRIGFEGVGIGGGIWGLECCLFVDTVRLDRTPGDAHHRATWSPWGLCKISGHAARSQNGLYIIAIVEITVEVAICGTLRTSRSARNRLAKVWQSSCEYARRRFDVERRGAGPPEGLQRTVLFCERSNAQAVAEIACAAPPRSMVNGLRGVFRHPSGYLGRSRRG